MRHRRLPLALLIALLVAIAVTVASRSAAAPNIARPATTPPSTASAAPVPRTSAGALAVRVEGNHLVDGAGTPIRLLGVNRAGSSYACMDGWGIFDGPHDDASVAAIAAWHVNAVRIDLNEDCWLGINGVKPSLSGPNYRNAIVDYVKLLHQHNLYAILELHWNAPGQAPAAGQQPMPDADHSPAFWQSVAATFRDDPAVVFDLYNEPYKVDWNCWLKGCAILEWQAVGMQHLVDVVRATGAKQPIMLGGLDWANDLGDWLRYKPHDPAEALIASFHVYDDNRCNQPSCWSSVLEPIRQKVPVVAGEVGERDCGHAFLDGFMGFADARGISYLAWVWDTWGCGGNGIALISSYDGTPTKYGEGLRDHLLTMSSLSPN